MNYEIIDKETGAVIVQYRTLRSSLQCIAKLNAQEHYERYYYRKVGTRKQCQK